MPIANHLTEWPKVYLPKREHIVSVGSTPYLCIIFQSFQSLPRLHPKQLVQIYRLKNSELFDKKKNYSTLSSALFDRGGCHKVGINICEKVFLNYLYLKYTTILLKYILIEFTILQRISHHFDDHLITFLWVRDSS